jgi:hypothetical protein
MRIRSTKPEFWRSKTISALPWDVRLVLKGLESYVDDNGVGKDDIALIASDVFPRDLSGSPLETLARLTEAISLLNERGLVARYELDGEDLLYIDKWKDLQRIDKPGRGRFPRPDGSFEYADEVDVSTYRVIRETVARPPETVAPVTGEQGNRGTGEQRSSGAGQPAPRRKPEVPLPDGWGPSNTAFEYCQANGIDLRHEESQFRNHVAANDRRQRDWDAAFRTWLGNAKKYTKPTPTERAMRTVQLATELDLLEVES